MARGSEWLPSSGVGPILGDGRPSPSDIIRIAEEQAELERLAEKQGTTLQLSKTDIPKAKITGLHMTLTTDIKKVKS
jgi:hypothetical protein